jgi:hypothetical protein
MTSYAEGRGRNIPMVYELLPRCEATALVGLVQ